MKQYRKCAISKSYNVNLEVLTTLVPNHRIELLGLLVSKFKRGGVN